MDEVFIRIELGAIVICNCYPAADFPLHKEDVRVYPFKQSAQMTGQRTMQ